MDAGEVFVLLLSALVIGVLAYLELKSRRSKQQESQSSAAELDQDPTKTDRKP
jgi:hypothetical protein